ncbi:acyl-coenzyme A thioesterase 1-like [Thunnus thynnus]|uniref:acyl-coenzyme A thioesterase 1-like n=1 Tax=Thunnus thynnus TaxID=8237 RepID=UPI003526D126
MRNVIMPIFCRISHRAKAKLIGSLVSEEMACQVRLRLLPSARCLFDEHVQVKVAGLRSRQVVTMKARSTDEKGVEFSSSATYRADGSGEVDLERDPSLSGSYVGVEPMGLLWSMRADTLHKRFQKNRSLNPHVVKFSVHEVEGEGSVLAEATNERLLIGDGVTRLPIKEGNICGVLFTPPEDDLNWDSKAYMDQMVERLKRHGKENFESVCYPGAGHYLEPPYGPYCQVQF